MRKIYQILITAFLLNVCLGNTILEAQPQPRKLVDYVVAVIGNQVVLRSDLEIEMAQITQAGETITDELKCFILKELMKRKLLVHQAELDSLFVEEERLEEEVNGRIKMFASQVGGERKLEQYLGKSISEYKKEMRPKIQQQIMAREMEQKVTGDVRVNPSEVREFFEKIPQDSLPLIGKQVELGQIIIKPKASQVAKDYARDQLTKIRRDIIERGSDFSYMAKLNSEDPGSKDLGGLLGEFGRGDMVPEFERAVFKLKKDSISPIIETAFGFHIIQLIERRGERVEARHILIRPRPTSFEIRAAMSLADSIKRAFEVDKTPFCDLVKAFTEDDMTKGTCGFYYDPQTNSSKIPYEYLDVQTLNALKTMGKGEMSSPKSMDMPDGSKVIRLMYLKEEHDEHSANLRDDYARIQIVALDAKKEETMEAWVLKKIKNTYFSVDQEYRNCDFFRTWNEQKTQQ